MPEEASTTRTPSRRALIVLVIVVAALFGGIFALRGAGRWLVRQDTLAKSDTIVVLSGGMPFRAEEAARIFRESYAPEVWVTYPVSPAANLERIGIHYIGEEEYSREILIREGVPPSAIRILPDEILNTEQEVHEVAQELQRAGKSRVIFVTSPQHTRRVKTLWRKATGNDANAIARAASNDLFDAAHWWRTTRDALSVVREYLGLLNAWAGLPVRPQ